MQDIVIILPYILIQETYLLNGSADVKSVRSPSSTFAEAPDSRHSHSKHKGLRIRTPPTFDRQQHLRSSVLHSPLNRGAFDVATAASHFGERFVLAGPVQRGSSGNQCAPNGQRKMTNDNRTVVRCLYDTAVWINIW